MIFPEGLPEILEYRVGETVRGTLPRRPVESISSSGKTNAPIVCPRIPLGCTGWRHTGEKAWRELKDIPKAWLPFLNRERPGPMDFRPAPREIPRDAIMDFVE